MYRSSDLQSVLYLLLFPSLIIFQWQLDAIQWILYALTCVLSLGIVAINHNIGHLPMWKSRALNQFTEYLAGTLQGVPLFLFKTVHIDSHHRYNQSEEDATRVARAGDHNHLLGYLIYPLYSLAPVRSLRGRYLSELSRSSPEFRKIVVQHFLLIILWGVTFSIDWQRTLIFIIIPQVIGIHFLMASNYLQHAQCEVGSEYNHSRNFTGKCFNWLFLNVGYHTAHHLQDRIHWTELPHIHESIKHHIDERLCQKNFIGYFLIELTAKPIMQRRHHFAKK